ncbi:sigma-54 dependent transcriptional regulator [soil metagenome]
MIQPSAVRVLVTDDIPDFLREMAAILRPVFSVSVCSSPLRAVRLARQGECDILITTLIMREMDGFEVIRRVRGNGLSLPIIMITGRGDENTSIEAVRLGANDYLNKPVEPDELRARIHRVLAEATPSTKEEPKGVPLVVTQDATMLRVLDLCSRVAKSDSRVLILGETGTGKELFAKTLHAKSTRLKDPFVEVNCAAIPSNLIESELFGHERGAFTGATERRIGRFEEAGKGTLFLDEVGELGIALQSKLLRVLQTGDYSRVGGTKGLKSEARVVAATNRDLEEEVRAGRFRADLYYRLNVVTLEVPPLRDRFSDIPLLVDHFNHKFTQEKSRTLSFSSQAMRHLCDYRWPGNVRELEHLIERLSVLFPGQDIGEADLPSHLQQAAAQKRSSEPPAISRLYHEALRDFETHYFQGLIGSTNGNLAAAARLAGMDRSQFFRKVTALGLRAGA